ncbi:cytochrome-c peroxidase [Botryobacter ruber]|uniref:cytochrome-c peroxidase n=1 Tax=Botryobacter ruber TaxID=2171629 RepID=UPI0013E324E6|nr:cytochrome c peroxidase [Botryobacter ruber]
MKTIKKYLFLCLIIFSACQKNDPEASGPTAYKLETPVHFPLLQVPEDNPMTQEGVDLGRRLFYDRRLSNDGTRSCSSCHVQASGFTTPGTTVLPIVNLGWSRNFLWKGKVRGQLEDITLFEVKEFFKADPAVFTNDPEYARMFKKAYRVEEVTHKELAYALAQFFRTMISANSPFDRNMQNKYVFTPSEENGMQLFFSEKGDCFHCHGNVLFTNNEFHNIGLEAAPDGQHLGLYEITGNPADKGKFKTPTLRNVSLRKSYMHDGRFKTLEEVVEHYNSGIKASPTLDPLLYKNRDNFNLGLTEQEKQDLVAFLETLTDQEFVTNPNLSNPHK